MALFSMVVLITVGVIIYAEVLLYSLKRESDQLIS
jgi:hypothetical protein